MKANIHPQWFEEAKVTCACGNSFIVGATFPEIRVEVCYNCHPFYTGQMKYVDTAGRVDAFKAKQAQAKVNVISKTEKRRIKKEKKIQRELERPESLAELRKIAKRKTQNGIR
ncbi:MAG: 50S ribosomal protein L31 [Microgenomates group bacterium GW2011_GWC1_37_8]|uniref:Large ribosomal subunit protein bL31 n=1 Tax=Candidatus Woesebacteria bacterium GW2011_GWB1_38_8 TaxID=1618570 RepID=A0A0G0L4J3_9BACT|nr:MAG: 50S ribosomal protein L31 [Microgenomates group bacterium GW2011_GWC1_37_8]KKQ85942.1 MAG: 50S ribosomal protein L31 [Candidatus Woesebacteria bacterium GW2011_GWB1_38_8]